MTTRKARLSEGPFNPHAGIDLDAIVERTEERDFGAEFEALQFAELPQERKSPRRNVAMF